MTDGEGRDNGTTVVNTGGGGNGGGFGNIGGALVGLAVLVAVIIGGYILLQMNHRSAVRGDAVTSAVKSVGSAADRVAHP